MDRELADSLKYYEDQCVSIQFLQLRNHTVFIAGFILALLLFFLWNIWSTNLSKCKQRSGIRVLISLGILILTILIVWVIYSTQCYFVSSCGSR